MTLALRLYSDFICPFCYIAEKSSLQRLMREWDLELDWRGFQLHPQTPPGGIAMDQYFPAAKLPAMRDHMFKLAQHFGVDGMCFPERLSNTRRALRLAEVARDAGKLADFRMAVMDAYWQKGRDIEDTDVLNELVRATGLSDDALHIADWQHEYDERITLIRAEGEEMGVTGIPTFVLEGYAVAGCQPYEVLERLATTAGASRRKRFEDNSDNFR